MSQFLEYLLVVILNGTNARRLQKAIIASDAMGDFHARGVDNLGIYLLACQFALKLMRNCSVG
jgi:hypothetical protein